MTAIQTDIKAQVRAFINENFIMGAKTVAFADSDSFMDSHLIDSTGFLELVTWLEETFRVKVEDAEMIPENLDCLNAVSAYVARKLAA